MSLYLRRLALGPMKNFVYLVGREDIDATAVVDPAWDVDAIVAAAEEDGRRLTHALLTHRHFDHCNGVPDVLARGIPVFAHRDDAAHLAVNVPASEVTKVSGGDRIDVGGLAFTCVHTPGHTPGSQCFHLDFDRGVLLSGDTVFVDHCGRCDRDGGDPRAMFDSLTRVLGGLDAGTRVLPGHDYGPIPETTLARERAENPYFSFSDADAFTAYRMRPK